MTESAKPDVHYIESELGCWTQTSWSPADDDPLVGIVESIWDFEGVLSSPRERVFPNGTLELVVQLDEPHRLIAQAEARSFPALCIDGLQTAATTIEGPNGRCRVLGIRLHPLGARAVLATSPYELTDASVDLRDAIGRAADELAQRLAAARHGRARTVAAIAWARGRTGRFRECDPSVARLVQHIVRFGGAVPIRDLDGVSGRSRSRLVAAFRDHVGVVPKRFARLIRFRRALEALAVEQPIGAPCATASSLSAIALALGYFDQAHMTAEFKEHAGVTPRAYREGRRYPGSNHLAEPR